MKNDLEEMDEHIDILGWIKPMNLHITLLLQHFVYLQSKELVESYQRISNFMINYKLRESPIIVRFKNGKDDYKEGNVSFTPIDLTDIIDAFKFMDKHPHISLDITYIDSD